MLSSNPAPQKKTLKYADYRKKFDLPNIEEYKLEFSKLPYHNHREFLEYVLSQDPETKPYAARASYLLDKEQKTPIETRELELLIDISSRPFAARIIELEKKSELTKFEKVEYDWITNPVLRPLANEVLQLIDMNYFDRSIRKSHLLDLLVNYYTIFNAHEIVELEEKTELTPQEIHALSFNYLLSVGDIPLAQRKDYDKKVEQIFTTPQTDCSANDIPGNLELAKIVTIKDKFDQAAKNLMEASFRQSLRKSVQFFQGDILQQPHIRELCDRRSADLSLALAKFFYENRLVFNQENFYGVVDYINKQIQEQKFSFKESGYQHLYRTIGKLYLQPDAPQPLEKPEKNTQNHHRRP